MARTKVLQNNLIVGAISPSLLGRIDLDKYYSAVEDAENVVIMPHGGMKRRGGLRNITQVTLGSRLFSFEFSITQNYVMVFSTTDVKIYKPDDDTLYATLDFTTEGLSDLTTTQLEEIDIIQSADTVIVTHEDHPPFFIQRQGDDVTWGMGYINLVNIPKFDYDPTKTPTIFNYGDSLTLNIKSTDIVYNAIDGKLYDATYDVDVDDLSKIDLSVSTIDYTNDGSPNSQTVNAGTVILNADGNEEKGLDNHVYIAKVSFGSVDISTIDYLNLDEWRDNGTYADIGKRPDVWGDTNGTYVDRGYPRTCTFHQGRLWFGGSRSKPTSVWGSVVNDFFNFDINENDVLPDSAIFDVLDTDQFNAIQNITSGTKLQVLTAGGEFVNTEDILTPQTSSWVRYTGYGAKRLKPVTLDGATYFMDRFGKTVRSLIYNYAEGGYTSPPISILSEHLINNVVDLDIVRGSSLSVANLLYLVNSDGTVAVFNTMRNENINGWTQWTTQGKFKRVVVTGDVVSFIVERDGNEYLEVLDEDILLDHSFINVSSDKVEVDDILFNNELRVVGDSITQTTTQAVDESGTYYAYADHLVDDIYAGLNYDVKIITLPIAANTKDEGNIRHLPNRITKCIVQLYESRGVYVNGKLVTNRQFGDPTDEAFPLITGQRDTYLLGYNKKAQVEISQVDPDPMTLLALDMEVSY